VRFQGIFAVVWAGGEELIVEIGKVILVVGVNREDDLVEQAAVGLQVPLFECKPLCFSALFPAIIPYLEIAVQDPDVVAAAEEHQPDNSPLICGRWSRSLRWGSAGR